MSRESTLAKGRAAALSGMTSKCTITRPSAGSLDRATGKYSATGTTIYDGVCKFVMDDNQPREVAAQAQEFAEQEAELHLPVGTSVNVLTDDQFEIYEDDHDARLVGLKGRISGIHAKTYATARRFPVEVLT